MPHRRIRAILVPLAVLLVLVLGHAAAWAWVAAQVDAGTQAWLAGVRARGWQVTAEPARRTGWPLSAGAEYGAVTVQAGPDGPAWTAERVVVELPFLHPRTVRIRPEGRQALRPSPARDGSTIPIETSGLVASVPLDDPETVELAAQDLSVGAPLNAAAQAVHLQAGPLTLRAQAGPVRLPAGLGWALGDGMERVELQAALSTPVPPAADMARRLRAWRDAGGTLLLRQAAVRWGPLDAQGSATLMLDGRLQPSGTGTVRLRGAAEALDRLAAAGVLPARTALTVKAVLSLLARPAPEGGGAEVQVPLTLSDGIVRMGQVPLARLPDGPWTTP